jgi:ppGpp synthetase/RelA/SpoT-type nucleotidyltranferase
MNKSTREFEIIRPTYERCRVKITSLIKELISESNIDIVSIESRTKEIESFEEKTSRPEKNYKDPLKEITDLCGIRIITYYTEEIYKIAELLETEFEVDLENSIDKTKMNSPDKFGYLSLHYVIKLGEKRNELIEWKAYKDLKFEIQIRTILQHSWAAIDHKLRYKTKGEIPSILKRKIYRLSALLELADEQFLSIKKETESLQNDIDTSIDSGNLKIEINALSLESFLNSNLKVDKIIEIASNCGYMTDEEENDYGPETYQYFIQRLITIINKSSIKSIEDLDKLLNSDTDKIKKAFIDFLKVFKTKTTSEFYTVDTDLISILIIMLDKEKDFSNNISIKDIDWEPFLKTIQEIKK